MVDAALPFKGETLRAGSERESQKKACSLLKVLRLWRSFRLSNVFCLSGFPLEWPNPG